MPISFRIFPDQNLLVTRYFDLVSDQDLTRCYRQVYATPGFEPGFNELALHEGSEVLDLSTSALLEVIEETTRFHSKGNCTTRTIHVVGKLNQELMMDFYSSLASTFPDSVEQVEIVSHVEDALEKLGLDLGEIPIDDLSAFDFAHLTISDRHRISELQDLIDDKTMAIVERNRKLLELASTDALTKLLNRASIESLIKQEIDRFMIDGVRNFLFGPPGAGGFDLASLNIQRGRDHGLPTYNQTRIDFGLAPATSFADISSDPDTQAALSAAYTSSDDVDIWVGGLAEDP